MRGEASSKSKSAYHKVTHIVFFASHRYLVIPQAFIATQEFLQFLLWAVSNCDERCNPLRPNTGEF